MKKGQENKQMERNRFMRDPDNLGYICTCCTKSFKKLDKALRIGPVEKHITFCSTTCLQCYLGELKNVKNYSSYF